MGAAMKKSVLFFLLGFVLTASCFAGNPPSTTDAVVFTNDCIVYTMPDGVWSLADNYWLTNTWVRDGDHSGRHGRVGKIRGFRKRAIDRRRKREDRFG